MLNTRLLAVNLTGLALVGAAFYQGWITEIYHGDSSRLSVAIAGLFLVGLAFCFLRGREDTVRWIASALVKLGLIGTVLGFIQALSGIKLDAVGDAATIGPMVAALISGMGVALYTTLVGAALNLWLSLNLKIIGGHDGRG